jgi:hypothetical protein
MTRILWESKDKTKRIVEVSDTFVDFEDLCGDTYKPELHPEIPRETILKELEDFRELVEREGVFGYALEVWNPTPGTGWTHVDSCFGFVGQYSETKERFKHYIVVELIKTAKES